MESSRAMGSNENSRDARSARHALVCRLAGATFFDLEMCSPVLLTAAKRPFFLACASRYDCSIVSKVITRRTPVRRTHEIRGRARRSVDEQGG